MAYPFPFVAGNILTAAELNALDTEVAPAFLPMASGGTYENTFSSTSISNPTANQLRCLPIYVTPDMTATTLSIYTLTVTTAGVARLGIYSSGSDGVPSTLLVDAGTVSYTTNNTNYSVTISTALPAAWYWLGVVVQSGSSTWKGLNNVTPVSTLTQRAASPANNTGPFGYSTDSVTGALPAAPTFATSFTHYIRIQMVVT